MSLKTIWFCVLFSMSTSAFALDKLRLCMTGKMGFQSSYYQGVIQNVANLALKRNNIRVDEVTLKNYFYSNQPLSEIAAYNEMVADHCSAIIGYDRLSDILLLAKLQKDTTIPIFVTYTGLSNTDVLPENIFILRPSYDYLAQQTMRFLYNKFGNISNVLLITSVDRSDLERYETAFINQLKRSHIAYDDVDIMSSDDKAIQKIKRYIAQKHYSYVFVLTSAFTATRVLNMLDHESTVFIGAETLGSSSNSGIYVGLNDKNIHGYVIRCLDFLQENILLKRFYDAYVQQYTNPPNIPSAYMYDAISMVLKTWKQKHKVSVQSILSTNYNGITGVIVKNNHIYPDNEFIILSIESGGFVRAK